MSVQKLPGFFSCVAISCVAIGVVAMFMLDHVSAEQRCVCTVDKDSWFFSFDLLKFKLPLPCTYRMTRLRTRTGCEMTVNLVMSEGNRASHPAGMTYLVSVGDGVTSGTVTSRGAGVSDPESFGTVFYPPGPISMNGVEVFCYTDDLGFKSALFPACAVSLHYQANGYLGIYSRNTSDDFYSFDKDYLCGDCNHRKGEMGMLGSDVLHRMKSWEDRTAAMLYYTSRLIVGGNDQCLAHANTMNGCPSSVAYHANQICGCILSPRSSTGRCMRTRTRPNDRFSLYYACVQQFCSRSGSALTGCSMIRQKLRRNRCPVPDELTRC